MTNTMVYGEFMHFDSFLWKLRQLSRTFANYAIGFIFLFGIFKYLLFPSTKQKSPKDMIKELLIASVLVQSSWFLMMAVIDLSTIGLATVSSFPSQVIANNETYRTALISNIKGDKWLSKPFQNPAKGIIINAFADSFSKNQKEQWIEEYDLKEVPNNFEERLIDQLLPQPDNLGWPLTYLGLSVFKTHTFISSYNLNEANCVEEITKIVISLVLDAGMIILYTFALLMLVIILIMRLVVIRIAIITSPFIALIWGLRKTFEKSDLLKVDLLNVKKIFFMIFKPVMFALWISIMLVFIVIIQGFFRTTEATGTRFDQGSVSIKESRIEGEAGTPQYRSDLTIGENMKVTLMQGTKSFKDILLALISLTMMRYFVKLAISSKTDMKIWSFDLDRWTTGTLESTEKIIGNLGVIPTPAGAIGFRQVRDGNSSLLLDKKMEQARTQMDRDENERRKFLEKAFWFDQQMDNLTTEQINKLGRASTITWYPKTYPELISSIKTQNNGIRFTDIKSYIPQWVDNNRTQNDMKQYFWESWNKVKNVSLQLTPDKLEEDLKEIFSQSSAVKAFYKNVLGGTREDISTLQQLNSTLGNIK